MKSSSPRDTPRENPHKKQVNPLSRRQAFQRDHFRKTCPSSHSYHDADPYDKLVSSDQLNYLPNLYLRQYRLIDELARIRHDFPEQNYLLPRPRTTRDTLL
jgi:hypothetical protein